MDWRCRMSVGGCCRLDHPRRLEARMKCDGEKPDRERCPRWFPQADWSNLSYKPSDLKPKKSSEPK